MSAPTRPSSTPAWTQGNTAQQQEPTTGEKLAGYVPNQRPPSKKLNWVLGNISDWIDWFDYNVQKFIATSLAFDAVVGTNGTHATINDLMSDPNISQISRVLVTTPQTLIATQTINADDIEFIFKPAAMYSKGLTLDKGISITGNRVRIVGGRFTSWNTGGDIAIKVESGAKNCLIHSAYFVDNDTSISDSGTNTTLANNVEEI